jgi:hypothetical protein
MVRRAKTDSLTLDRCSQSSQHLCRHFSAAMAIHRDAFVHPDADLAVDTCFRMVFSTLINRLAHGPTFESPVDISWDRSVQLQAQACAAFLLGDAATSSGSRPGVT